ncbi:hypothetical protein HGRIS_008069 [Hohenbuehelia grisea]|uniref:Sec39 domain-containing protein n=1 Tax=Hohenbuehelia grisea TaxID=104357 RepID=A0ABR3J7A2_9AGAR
MGACMRGGANLSMTSTPTNPYAEWIDITDDELTVSDVEHKLKPLKDDVWVTAACVDKLVSDTAVQRALLELGIERTEGALLRSKEAYLLVSSPDSYDEENVESSSSRPQESQLRAEALAAHFRGVPADARLCQLRAVLLTRLDRLKTYEDICKNAPSREADEDEVEVEEWEDDPWGDGGEASSPTKSTTSPISLPDFLTDSLLRSTMLFAASQWFAAVRILFERHGTVLWPYRLVILDNVPYHALPSEYRNIMPSYDLLTNAERLLSPNNWRSEDDWTEQADVQAAIQQTIEDLDPSDNENLTHASRPEPLNLSELVVWYKDRVDHVISSTGMVDTALTVIQHGASQGLPDLDELGEDLSLLSRLVYDAPQPPDGVASEDWTYALWRAMDPSAVIRAYLQYSTSLTIAKDIPRLVMPYLFVLESRAERAGEPDPELPTRLLYEYILSAPLELAAAIFEASKPTLPPAQRLIRGDEDVTRLALACLYGSSSLGEWPTMSRIFECLPEWNIPRDEDNDQDVADTTIVSLGAFVTPSTARPRCTASDLLVFFKPLPLASLSRALDVLDVHLESGEILARWSVPAPLRWFLQSHNNAAEQRSWATRMARRAGGTEDHLDTQDDWEWLMEDMLKLSGQGDTGLRGAFGLIPQKEIIHIFFSGLLSTGKFDIAKGLMATLQRKELLDASTIEEICLECSREFYDNASSGNYKVGDMKLAYDCLDVPPQTERVKQDKEFIEATSRLSSFNVMSRPGMPISPIEIRLTKDRLSLVSRVLTSNADAYRHTEVMLDLVYKLGFRDDTVAEVKTLAMLADTALQTEDFARAYEVSERMVDTVFALAAAAPLGLDDPEVQAASEVCWVACFQLGRQPEFADTDQKLRLLGRALEVCPAEKLHDVLTAWRRLESEDAEARQARLALRRSGVHAAAAPRKPAQSALLNPASLRARLQHFHMPTPPLLSTPDAAALASRTFRSVAATFPFSVGSRGGRSQMSHTDEGVSERSGSRMPVDVEEVSAQATRVLSKGIGWLIGSEDE